MWFLRLSAVMQFPIRKYLAPALEAGLPPGDGHRFDENLWRELIGAWFP